MNPPDIRVAMLVKSCKDVKKINDFLKRIYLQGIADGQNATIDDSFRFLRIDKNVSYQCQCPLCEAWLELDLEGLLNEN